VTVRVVQAEDRFTFGGSRVPVGPTLLFPGALPLHFDTPYLRVDPTTSAVQFGEDDTIDLRVELTDPARMALTAALGKTITACVAGRRTAPSTCPLPSSDIVPGSLTGRIVGAIGTSVTFEVGTEAAGTISMTGTLTFRGTYRRLDYENVAHTRNGPLSLHIEAAAFPVAPLSVHLQDRT
jgi:hypothetical protein